MQDLLKDIDLSNPATLLDLSKEQLVELDVQLDSQITELTAMKSEARKLLLPKIDLNGEIINDQQVIRAEKVIIKTSIEDAEAFGAVIEEVDPEKITLEIARSLNATKRAVDAPMIRKLLKKGTDIPGIEKVPYLMIRPVTKSKDVETAG